MRLGALAVVTTLVSATAGGEPPGVVEGRVSGRAPALSGAVVYLVPDQRPPGAPLDTVLIDQKGLRFSPSVVVVGPGGVVEFRNSDPLLHNVFGPGTTSEAFDLGTYPSPGSRYHTFESPGPHLILCHVHPEMVAYVFVAPGPHAAVTDDEGRFRITGVPPGSYTLHLWHRRMEPREERVRVRTGERVWLELEMTRR